MIDYTVRISEDTKAFLENQAAAGGFATVGDYLLTLIQAQQTKKTRTELEAKLLEGLKTPFVPAEDSFLDDLEAELKSRKPKVIKE